jgi:hypothetical protein
MRGGMGGRVPCVGRRRSPLRRRARRRERSLRARCRTGEGARSRGRSWIGWIIWDIRAFMSLFAQGGGVVEGGATGDTLILRSEDVDVPKIGDALCLHRQRGYLEERKCWSPIASKFAHPPRRKSFPN